MKVILEHATASDYLTVGEAAKILRVRHDTVHGYMYLERLNTYKFKTFTMVRKDEVELIAKSRVKK